MTKVGPPTAIVDADAIGTVSTTQWYSPTVNGARPWATTCASPLAGDGGSTTSGPANEAATMSTARAAGLRDIART
jgi:hypothetical protein